MLMRVGRLTGWEKHKNATRLKYWTSVVLFSPLSFWGCGSWTWITDTMYGVESSFSGTTSRIFEWFNHTPCMLPYVPPATRERERESFFYRGHRTLKPLLLPCTEASLDQPFSWPIESCDFSNFSLIVVFYLRCYIKYYIYNVLGPKF